MNRVILPLVRFKIDVLMNNQELDIVGSNICEYDEKLEKAISVRKVPENDPEIKKLLKTRNPVNHMSAMYRKDKDDLSTVFLNDNIYILKGNLMKIVEKIYCNSEFKKLIDKNKELDNINLLILKGCLICYE